MNIAAMGVLIEQSFLDSTFATNIPSSSSKCWYMRCEADMHFQEELMPPQLTKAMHQY